LNLLLRFSKKYNKYPGATCLDLLGGVWGNAEQFAAPLASADFGGLRLANARRSPATAALCALRPIQNRSASLPLELFSVSLEENTIKSGIP